jgi:outer membrane protein OmpA-like peptidoglycan-associated protein
MKVLTRILMVLAIISLGTSSFGQIKRATRQINQFKYSKAVKVLEKAAVKKDTIVSREAELLLATCYRMQNDVPKSKEWYGKIVNGSKNPDSMAVYYYAQALRSSGEYPAAKQMFLKYAELTPKNPRGVLYANYCDSVSAWKSRPAKFNVAVAASLNSGHSDFSPVFYEKGLLFASDRSNRTGKGSYLWTGNSYIGLFYTEPNKAGNYSTGFTKPKLVKGLFNSGYHNGPITFDKDFNKAFVTQTTIYKVQETKGPLPLGMHLLKIYDGTKKNGKFRSMKSFFLNSKSYSVGHPALSPDGKTLYFISDMPGGFGGTDIWFSTFENEKWNEPLNAGPGINTPENEMFPFISAKGDLYFSSTGLPGFGGLDLFVAHKKGNTWSQPVNLGIPANSSYDDFAFAVDRTDSTGIFSSNRPGGSGQDDLYTFQALPEIKIILPVFLSGCVKDKTTGQPMVDVPVTITQVASGKVTTVRTDVLGCFRTNIDKGNSYVVKAVKPGFTGDCLTVVIDVNERLNDLNTPRVLLLEKIAGPKVFTVGNIYYDFDKSAIRADAKPVLDSIVRIMKENAVTLDISSFTDCRGSASYNEVLSQKRAESVIRYLVSQGIDASRITGKGYGESQPVNKCVDNVPCTKEEQQANRRTEFRIISPPQPVKQDPGNPCQNV